MTPLNDLCLLFGGFVLNVGETNEVWNLQLVPGDGTLASIAVRIGRTKLIDNVLL